MHQGSFRSSAARHVVFVVIFAAAALLGPGRQRASVDRVSMNPGALYATDSIVGKLRYIPATSAAGVLQGSPTSEGCRETDETQFTHILTREFAIMETELTRQMWADLRAVQPSLPVDPSNVAWGEDMSQPANKVTWYEAALFSNLLSLQQGLTRCYYTTSSKKTPITSGNYKKTKYYCDFSANGYRLPSEGEWEYACRAGTKGPFWFNEPQYVKGCSDSLCTTHAFPSLSKADWFYCNAKLQTHPAGKKKASPWKLKDLYGNVREWCWDLYNFYPSGTMTNYTGPEGLRSKAVIRGGAYIAAIVACRSDERYANLPTYRADWIGFRLVRTIP